MSVKLAFVALALTMAQASAADLGLSGGLADGFTAEGATIVGGGGVVRVLRPVFARSAPDARSAFLQPVAKGQQVEVPACLSDYSWCHVIAGGLPGWLLGSDLAFVEGARALPLAVAGPRIGIGVTVARDVTD